MTKTIPGVPESLTREQYTSLFEAIGFDPFNVLRVTFDVEGIRATVFERDADGQKIVTNNGYAKHQVYIPVAPYIAEDEQETAK